MLAVSVTGADNGRVKLDYAPAPVANPLKGLVPYSSARPKSFPHTMEFNYLPLSALVKGEDEYEWAELEKLLNDVAGRGNQTVFRIHAEYPGRKGSVPQYLLKNGLRIHRYDRSEGAGSRPSFVETPDYSNKDLQDCLAAFIAALGKKYDGDVRIGFITAGLLGTWGEWHTYPRVELWAGRETQEMVMEAYEKYFRKTPVLLRYPSAGGRVRVTANAGRNFGYHDDSFAWATLETGRKQDGGFFISLMKKAGLDAVDKWKAFPIGGEIRPEAWGNVFDKNPSNKQVQDFAESVRQTHATWLMDTGMFQKRTRTAERVERAKTQVAAMGYEYHVKSVTWKRTGTELSVTVAIENRGVAPFYYDWPVDFALLSEGGEVTRSFTGKGKLTGILPGDDPRVWNERFNINGIKSGKYQLAQRVPNPMPNGYPLRFANKTQDRHAEGWLTLAPLDWE